jgi:serine/threonine protein kinase
MSEIDPIPTAAQIEACTNFVEGEYRNRGMKLVRIGKYIIKYGGRTSHLEAENNLYLAANCNIRVPKCYGYGHLPDSNKKYIIMEFIEGDTLQKLYTELDQVDRDEIIRQIREQVTEYRSMPAPDWLGSLGRKPLAHYAWRRPPTRSSRLEVGPFNSIDEFTTGIMLRINQSIDPELNAAGQPALELMDRCMREILKDSRVVWTHGDLMPRNIMIHKDGVNEDGSGIFTVVIIDWESAGWYPEWWDWATHEVHQGNVNRFWTEALPQIMPMYPKEYFLWDDFIKISTWR